MVMSNLTSFAQLFKKIATGTIIIVVVIILLALIFFRFKSKENQHLEEVITSSPLPSPQIIQNPNQKQPGIVDLSKIKLGNFAQVLPVFQVQPYDNFTSQEAKNIASVLNITVDPSFIEENTLDGTQYNWQQENLSLSLSSSYLRYSNSKSPQTSQPLSEQQLKDLATTFIKNIPIADKNLIASSQKTVYLKKTDGLPVSSSSFLDSDIIELYFDKQLENLPLVENNPKSSIAVVRVDKSGQVTSLNLRLYKEIAKGDQYKLKSVETASEEIKNKKGKVVQTLILDENNQALELFRTQPVDINQATITKTYLAYLFPQDTQTLAQPIFVFEGEFTRDGQRGRLYIYLPAVENVTKP